AAAVEQVLRQRRPLSRGEGERLVAGEVERRYLALLLAVVQGDDLAQAHLLPAVPQADGAADVTHEVVHVAGVGVPVLRGAVLHLGDHQRRGWLGPPLAPPQGGGPPPPRARAPRPPPPPPAPSPPPPP